MQIAILLYPGFTALDALGPYEVLKMLPDADVRFVAHKTGPIATDRGVLVVGATHTLDETPSPDMLLVPGSEAQTAVAAADGKHMDWLRRAHETTRYTTSVCSGAVVLGAAGLLKGHPATTHWAAMKVLERFGAIARPSERIVCSDKVWTAAGVSAGIDLAFALVEEIAGREAAERIQLLIEYDPRPPQDAGHMDKASNVVREAARAEMERLSRNPMNAVAFAKLAWTGAIIKARKLIPRPQRKK